jgi:predicted branched-subunit amino acid permease
MMDTALTRGRSTLHRVDAQALRDVGPVLVGLIPFAMIVALSMNEADITVPAGVVGSALLFTGSAQLAAVSLISAGAGLGTVLLSVLIINSRLLLYGGALEGRFRSQPTWFQWLGPHFLVDQNYVLASARAELRDPDRFRVYWLTTAAAMSAVWLGTIGATMAVGGILPHDLPLSFAPIAVMVGVLVPKLRRAPARRAASASAIGAVIASLFAPDAVLIVGVCSGIAIEIVKGGPEK